MWWHAACTTTAQQPDLGRHRSAPPALASILPLGSRLWASMSAGRVRAREVTAVFTTQGDFRRVFTTSILTMLTACSAASGTGGEPAEHFDQTTEPLSNTTVYSLRIHVVEVVGSPFDAAAQTDFLADIAAANTTIATAGVKFEFDPAIDITRADKSQVTDCGDAPVGKYGDENLKGKIAVFYCPARGGGASSANGPNSVVWVRGTSLAHELGHYLGLGHPFHDNRPRRVGRRWTSPTPPASPSSCPAAPASWMSSCAARTVRSSTAHVCA